MDEIEKVLRSILDEKLSPVNESLQKLSQRIGTMDQNIEVINQRTETMDRRIEMLEDVMSKQFVDVKSDLSAIREQTAQNSEMRSELSETREDVETLKLDMKMVKKLILNQ